MNGPDPTPDIRLAAAGAGDIEALLPMIRQFYEHFGYPFEDAKKRPVVRRILEDESVGRLWLIEREGEAVGYLLLAFSFSLEFEGPVAFVDELFVASAGRQRGVGTAVLKLVEEQCLSLGIRTLRLETEAYNRRATELYLRSGYVDHGRHLMTKRLLPAGD